MGQAQSLPRCARAASRGHLQQRSPAELTKRNTWLGRSEQGYFDLLDDAAQQAVASMPESAVRQQVGQGIDFQRKLAERIVWAAPRARNE